ncbi:MAG: DUF4194 domain-containing protein [Mycobacterium leprae]
MDWVQQYETLTAREREDFTRILNRLLTSTFLLKQQEESRRDYYFVERYEPLLAGYLAPLGWNLVVDRGYGVVQVVNRQGGSRLQLKLMDSVLLLLLRLLYEEKRQELSLTADLTCQVQELHDKALALRIRSGGVIEKRYLREAFAIFRRFHLVELMGADVTDPSCRIKLLPSLLFAVRLEGLAELHERLDAYRAGGDENESADRDPVD